MKLVVGVPGTGHYLLGALLPQVQDYSFHVSLLRTIEDPGFVPHPPPPGHLEYTSSFPTDYPEDTLYRLDLIRIHELYPDIEYIFTWRDPVECVMSFYRRMGLKYDLGPWRVMKIVEDNLIYLNAQLQLLPRNSLSVVEYDCVVTDPARVEGVLGVEFDRAVELRPPRDYSGAPEYDFVRNYFTPTRRRQWAFLTSLVERTRRRDERRCCLDTGVRPHSPSPSGMPQ
jgi:hypothetical protein